MLFIDMTKNKNKINENYPVPETARAVLMSEGDWQPGWHRYHHTEIQTLKGEYGGSMYVYFFECERTGVTRPWGTAYLDVVTSVGAN